MNDPGLENVRAARHAISREFGNDPARLVAHYIDMQSRYKGGTVIEGPEYQPSEDKTGILGSVNPGLGHAEQR